MGSGIGLMKRNWCDLLQAKRYPARVAAFFMVLSLSIPASVQAINRCEDASGRVSYQDGLCPEDARSEVVKVPARVPVAAGSAPGEGEAPAAGARVVTLPGVGDVAFMTISGWETLTRPAGEHAVEVRMTAGSPNQPLTMLMTFIPNQLDSALTSSEHKGAVTQMVQQYVAGSEEQAIHLKQLNAPIGVAMLANFHDRRYQHQAPPHGEFRSVTAGLVNGQSVIVSVTILCNSVDDEVHDLALSVISSLLMTSDI